MVKLSVNKQVACVNFTDLSNIFMLFEPLQIRSIRFRNRIAISPMCQYSSVDGFANDWHLVHLGSRAVGGAALVIQEATAVTARGRISPDDMGLWKDEQIEPLKRITAFIRSQGAVPGIQLAHAGRKASTAAPWKGGKPVGIDAGGWITEAPSPIPFRDFYPVPEALSAEGLEQVKSSFREAALRALKAGFQVIEIHAAHGYLFHQFLSPLSNQRTDNYGGSFENRIRLLTETIVLIRKSWPDEFPLFVRISATDWADGGWNPEESVKLAAVLKGLGVDLIDVSSGGLVHYQKIPLGPGYQTPFAEKIKKETGMLTGAVGLITKPAQAEEILDSGKADLILIARESLRNPNFPLTAAKELQMDIPWPVQYERAKNA
ncbi:MAG TPA: NADH:flavin oxidoreductase/NADH oxidase [Puia sp.]|nr:NADH:flavin oxidoreductase/NADH oxidase [Puia sp.]